MPIDPLETNFQDAMDVGPPDVHEVEAVASIADPEDGDEPKQHTTPEAPDKEREARERLVGMYGEYVRVGYYLNEDLYDYQGEFTRMDARVKNIGELLVSTQNQVRGINHQGMESYYDVFRRKVRSHIEDHLPLSLAPEDFVSERLRTFITPAKLAEILEDPDSYLDYLRKEGLEGVTKKDIGAEIKRILSKSSENRVSLVQSFGRMPRDVGDAYSWISLGRNSAINKIIEIHNGINQSISLLNSNYKRILQSHLELSDRRMQEMRILVDNIFAPVTEEVSE